MKRGEGQIIVPHKYQIDALEGTDPNANLLYVNVSRKYVAIGSKGLKYFAPSELEETEEKEAVNKWGKFREVDKVMAYLCYDQKTHKNEDGTEKEYTVCYEDRFLGILETEVWRFH